MTVKWIWNKEKGLGPINFNEPIDSYIKTLGIVPDEDSVGDDGWQCYRLPMSDLFVYTEEDRVICLTAYKEFIYKGQNLIGMNVEDAEILLEAKADEIGTIIVHEDGSKNTPYEYNSLNLELFEEDGAVVLASVRSPDKE